MYFLGSEISVNFLVVTLVFWGLFGAVLNWFFGPTRHNLIASVKEGFYKAFVLAGVLFLAGSIFNWFRPVPQAGTFTAPVAVEEQVVVQSPLRFDTNFADEQVCEPTITTVTTHNAVFKFSSHGATLDDVTFMRELPGGKKQEFVIWKPEHFSAVGVAPFTVALDEKISAHYELVDQETTADFSSLTYKVATSQGQILKKFTIHKNTPVVDVSITVIPKKTMRPRMIWTNPMTKDLGQYDAMTLWVLPADGKLSSIRSNKIDQTQGYLQPTIFGAANKYFLCALVEDKDHFMQRAYARVADDTIVTYTQAQEVSEPTTWNMKFYFGPKELESLVSVDPRLEGVLDYGMLSFITKPMMRILKYCDHYTHNYGYAILLVTLLLKILLLPFTFRGERKMREFQESQKRLEYIEKKYHDNPEALQKARTEHALQNGSAMLGGCLPMLIQMPFFIGLNGGLSNSLELYKRPFIGWITDLSLPDSYYILPLLIFFVFFVTSVVNATKKDVRGVLSSAVMALLISTFFSTMASGLGLYMFFNSLLHLIQIRVQKALGL